ncbi:hypothetical protein [Bacillus marasmi]|uniref:hypothetical protein n=1 Tax=Bacillus marasmi TaxID=1926279 RepID=UPI0011CA79D1|nr:hypothetical protein [Bacillus marasmi]
MQDFQDQTKIRVRFIYMILFGLMAIILIRVGYMQLIYQKNIVTFAQIDQTAQELNIPIIEEVKKSFDVNLDRFREESTDDIINSGKTDVASLSLLDIVYTSCTDGCYGRPAVYLHENKGYIFYKNNKGENTLVEIKRYDERWDVVEVFEKSGE